MIKKYEDELFNNVEIKLRDFTKTSEYKNYIINNIKKFFNKDDNIKIFLTENDYCYKEDIINNVNINLIDIVKSDKDFIGGFIAILKNNILIDCSFKNKLFEEKENFNGFMTK